MDCTRCEKPATTILYGKYENGRKTIDHRCDFHKPLNEEIGTLIWWGNTARAFRLERMETMP